MARWAVKKEPLVLVGDGAGTFWDAHVVHLLDLGWGDWLSLGVRQDQDPSDYRIGITHADYSERGSYCRSLARLDQGRIAVIADRHKDDFVESLRRVVSWWLRWHRDRLQLLAEAKEELCLARFDEIPTTVDRLLVRLDDPGYTLVVGKLSDYAWVVVKDGMFCMAEAKAANPTAAADLNPLGLVDAGRIARMLTEEGVRSEVERMIDVSIASAAAGQSGLSTLLMGLTPDKLVR
jgi:hypothetical protein